MAMAGKLLVDTGPLVAFFNRNDRFHDWAVDALTEENYKLITCEAVISEVIFITKNDKRVARALISMVQDGFLEIHTALGEATIQIMEMVEKYSDLPSSLADLCLVWLSDEFEHVPIMTLDSDFNIYRSPYGDTLPVIMPN